MKVVSYYGHTSEEWDALTSDERQVAMGRRAPIGECVSCDRARESNDPYDMTPRHTARDHCQSGKRNHCTCDTCY